ncbi:MAG: hypothetical protein OXC41_02180 [Gammaproteobacteria bacterium]|nr:hypothetical protein [Gammaproteobacteria bacterium]
MQGARGSRPRSVVVARRGGSFRRKGGRCSCERLIVFALYENLQGSVIEYGNTLTVFRERT